MTPKQRERERRDAAVVAALKSGQSRRAVAKAFGISHGRACQIGLAAGLRVKPMPSPEMCERIRDARLAYLKRTRREPEDPAALIKFLRARIAELEGEIDELRGLD